MQNVKCYFLMGLREETTDGIQMMLEDVDLYANYFRCLCNRQACIHSSAVLSKSSLTFELKKKKKKKLQQLQWCYYRKIRNDVPYRTTYVS